MSLDLIKKSEQEQEKAFNLATSCPLTVIDAPPGCGKSYLARLLANHYAAQGITSLITAFNVKICADMCAAFSIDPEKMGTDSSGMISVLNFDKITSRSADAKGRKLSGIFWKLGSPKRDTRFLAESLGLTDTTRQGVTLSKERLAGLVERGYVRYCQSGADVPEWFHVERIFDDENDKDTDREIRTYLVDFVNALKVRIDKAASNAGKSDQYPMVGITTKYATMLRYWASLGYPVDADIILIDEAQDLDQTFMRAIGEWVRQGKRVILVGDPFQELYEWRGAKNAMDYALNELSAAHASLSVSRRFPAAIGTLASAIIKPVANSDSWVIGSVADIDDDGAPADAHLFYLNASAIERALTLPVCEIPMQLATELRDMVTDIWELYNDRRAQGPLSMYNIGKLYKAMQDDPRMSDVKRIMMLLDPSQTGTIEKDRVTAILDMVERCKVKNFTGRAPAVTTIHRTKGAEWNIVEVELPQPPTKPKNGKPARKRPTRTERMIAYVGVTRAKRIVRPIGVSFYMSDEIADDDE